MAKIPGVNDDLYVLVRRSETTKYWDAFTKQWNWITKYQVDHQHGGWYPTVTADGTSTGHAKSDGWTECYHQGRAMLTVSETLEQMADGK